MRSSLMLLSLVVLAGCPEPVPSDALAVDGAPPGGAAPPPGSNAPPPTDGVGVVAPSEEVQVEPGTGVVISGTFTYTGDAQGAYRVDISAQKASGPSVLVAKAVVPSQGPWQVEVPKNVGPIVVMAFIEQGHGPGGGTPTATVYGLTVEETTITGVALAPAAGGAVTGTPPGPAAAAGGAPPPGADAAAATAPAEAAPDAADATLPAGTVVSAPAKPAAPATSPTAAPTATPSASPTAAPSPAAKPSASPTAAPSPAAKPAAAPTAAPSPAAKPAAAPTAAPSPAAKPATPTPAPK